MLANAKCRPLLVSSASHAHGVSEVGVAGKVSGARTQLSTAVRPFAQPKTMPLVVHTGGNTLYEEPCLAYLHLHITKVCLYHLTGLTLYATHCSRRE